MSNQEEVLKWLKENLSSLLGFSVPDDLIQYIMSMKNEKDVEDYLRTLLNFQDPAHEQFWKNYSIISQISKDCPQGREDVSINGDLIAAQKIEKNNLGEGNDGSSNKKRDRFTNLYSPEGASRDVVMLKGRHHCNCQASKHSLVNNCLSCGRIVCSQEGSGPCFVCGSLVCSKEEMEFINAQTAQSKKLYDNLMSSGRPEGWEQALKHRDRLLDFDRTSERRTHVIDDEGEYFSINSVWLSPEEKKKLTEKERLERAKKHASRLEAKFTLDFSGRQFLEANDADNGEEEREAETEKKTSPDPFDFESTLINTNIDFNFKPTYCSSGVNLRSSVSRPNISCKSRVQDRELLEMSDLGLCLSMHQPWASLLVHGIKRHEGRTWCTAHRGRLWIAAASKTPNPTEIEEIEEFYRQFRAGENLDFPKHYPTSCLLGCVGVIDCLPQEDYQACFEKRESESPFVLICEDPHVLPLKFPMSGKHKIYKLDKQIHAAAQRMLLKEAK